MATKLHIVPPGNHNAASFPRSSATLVCKRFIVGSSSRYSSPTHGSGDSLCLHTLNENGAIAGPLETVLHYRLIRRAVIPFACGRRSWKLHDYDTLWRRSLERLLWPVSSKKLDRVTFKGFAYLTLVNVEFALVLRAFFRKDNIGSDDVCSSG